MKVEKLLTHLQLWCRNICLTREAKFDWQLGSSCIKHLIKEIWSVTSLIRDVWFTISACERHRRGEACRCLVSRNAAKEKNWLYLWWQLLTIIYPGIVCWASCSSETNYFIAIKLHSFPSDSWAGAATVCYKWPLSSFSSYFLSWARVSIRLPFSFRPCFRGMDDSGVGYTGVTHFKQKEQDRRHLLLDTTRM